MIKIIVIVIAVYIICKTGSVGKGIGYIFMTIFTIPAWIVLGAFIGAFAGGIGSILGAIIGVIIGVIQLFRKSSRRIREANHEANIT